MNNASSKSRPAWGEKLQKLFNLFNREVLDDPNPVPDNQDTLNLDVLLTDDFTFTFDPAHQLDSVMVSQIRLDNKYNRKKRVIVQVDGGTGMEELLKEMKYRNMFGKTLSTNQVQVTIKFRFKQFGQKIGLLQFWLHLMAKLNKRMLTN